MAETAPYLFFSYSRSDSNKYLERFHSDLCEEVRAKADIAKEKAGFRDLNDVKTGDAWYQEIMDSLAVAGVLVCMYSASYFSKSRSHEFCAKEFAAFLMRRGIRYDWYVDGQGQRHLGVVASQNVLPVLWHSEDELLALNDLPPPFVRSIKYDLQLGVLKRGAAETYRKDGMLGIVRRQAKGTYWPIIQYLAKEIILRAKSPPPPLIPKPLLDMIPNPFWDPAAGPGAGPT
jgi:hypothetical protein